MRSFMTSLLDEEFEEDGMGGACSMHSIDEKYLYNFGRKT